MYTAQILSKSIQRSARQVVIDVEFSDGTNTFTHKFTFSFDVTFDAVKQMIKQYINKLEQIDAAVDSIAIGVVDLTAVTDGSPTQADLDKRLWLQRDAIKDQVDKAIAKGYIAANNTKVTQLNTWLTNNFKPEYLDLL